MIQAIIFDLDNTLYAYDPAHAAGFAAVTEYAAAQLGLAPERFRSLHREADRVLRRHAGEDAAAIHSRLIRYQLLLEGLGLTIAHAPRMEEVYWTAFFFFFCPEPGVRETLSALRERGCRLGVGTNMTALQQFEKLRRLGLTELADFLVSSEEVSAEKPDGRLFACCVEKAGCPAGDCLFVGDDAQKDILGALSAGLRPVYFERKPGAALPAGVPVIRSISELPELLEREEA